MLILKDDKGKLLPKKVQKRVNKFIDNLKNVKWFEPSPELTKEEVEKQVNFTLECFGVKAKIQYKKLAKQEDWASALASAWDWASAWDSAWASARASALASAWDWASALDSALASAWDWASAWASAEILLLDNKQFNSKYPNGAFRQLFKLWEMGLYPVGILKNKKFVIYAKPIAKNLFKK